MRNILFVAAATALMGSMLGGCVPYGPGYGGPAYAAGPSASVSIGWHGDNYWDGHRYWARRDWEAHHPEQRGRPDYRGHDHGHDDHDDHRY